MNCGKLTATRVALIAAYLIILFGLDKSRLGEHNHAFYLVVLSSAMAVTIATWRHTCKVPPQERSDG